MLPDQPALVAGDADRLHQVVTNLLANARSRLAGGSGLGLAIVSAVAAAPRGRVSVASVPGDTVFVLTLPPAESRSLDPI